MDFSDPAQREVFFELHSGLPREGPGDRESMIRALALAGPLPAAPQVLDIACGPGGQTLDLAELIPDAEITALDGHPPFLLDLERRAAAAGLARRIRTVHGDMARLRFPPASFELIWCEGAAYIMGFQTALAAWKPLLKPGGILTVTEPVWLKDERPERVNACWAEYPAMADSDAAREAARACGYSLLGDFVLPEQAWWTHYYGPLEKRLPSIEARRTDPVARLVLDDARLEIDCHRRHADCYGYLMLVLRA